MHYSNILRVIALGMVSGMRGSSAPALLSAHYCQHPNRRLMKSQWAWVCSKPAAIGLGAMAAGEVVADKLPGIGDRIAAGGLIARGLSGAMAGAVLDKASGGKMPGAWGIGAVAAIGWTFASFYGRKALSQRVPDRVIAVGEDIVTYGLGAWAVCEAERS